MVVEPIRRAAELRGELGDGRLAAERFERVDDLDARRRSEELDLLRVLDGAARLLLLCHWLACLD